jgi:hypothetical protein
MPRADRRIRGRLVGFTGLLDFGIRCHIYFAFMILSIIFMQSKFEYDYHENFKKYNSCGLGLITIWRRNHTWIHSQKEGRWYDLGYKRRSPVLALRGYKNRTLGVCVRPLQEWCLKAWMPSLKLLSMLQIFFFSFFVPKKELWVTQ